MPQSKSAPGSADRCLCEEVNCMWRPHLIFLDSHLDARWQQEVWPRHENKIRFSLCVLECTCQSSAACEPVPFFTILFFTNHFFHDRMKRKWRAFFLRCRPVARLSALARSERALSTPACPPAKVMELTCRLSTCRVQRSNPQCFCCSHCCTAQRRCACFLTVCA